MMEHDEEEAQAPLRFSVAEADGGPVIAVVEAADAGDALQRFERIRHLVRASRGGLLTVREQSTEVPITTPTFFEGYFLALDAAQATRH
jgi:hypothetical protein